MLGTKKMNRSTVPKEKPTQNWLPGKWGKIGRNGGGGGPEVQTKGIKMHEKIGGTIG